MTRTPTPPSQRYQPPRLSPFARVADSLIKPLVRQPYHGHWNGHCNYAEIRAAELYRQTHKDRDD